MPDVDKIKHPRTVTKLAVGVVPIILNSELVGVDKGNETVHELRCRPNLQGRPLGVKSHNFLSHNFLSAAIF